MLKKPSSQAGLHLVDALRISPSSPPRLAFVGAGGKTSAMFILANQLINRGIKCVLVTTSTHLSIEQTILADRHVVIQEIEEIDRALTEMSSGVLLFTGPAYSQQQVEGLSEVCLQKLCEAADQHQFPLLIEADGSRQRPLKAPANHEPAIPAWVKEVVLVAGLSGVDKPLTADTVHRPERFSALTGIGEGKNITPDSLTMLLVHPAGGLKNIPAGAKRFVLFNQADSLTLAAAAKCMSTSLLDAFDAVITADLNLAQATRMNERKEHEGQDKREILAVYERIAGIVLAAGGAERLGQPKQLLSWRGRPLVNHVVHSALEAGLTPVVVVIGACADEVRQALVDQPVRLVNNPYWETGQSSSLIAGLQELPGKIGGAIFLLSDQPQIPSQLVRALVDVHSETLAPLIAPQIAGQRGNPVLFDRRTFPDLLSLTGDSGGRAIFSRYPITWLPWLDENALLDVDTPEDYARLLQIE
jgi:molybdenum cofactor cytidylyltransferase